MDELDEVAESIYQKHKDKLFEMNRTQIFNLVKNQMPGWRESKTIIITVTDKLYDKIRFEDVN